MQLFLGASDMTSPRNGHSLHAQAHTKDRSAGAAQDVHAHSGVLRMSGAG